MSKPQSLQLTDTSFLLLCISEAGEHGVTPDELATFFYRRYGIRASSWEVYAWLSQMVQYGLFESIGENDSKKCYKVRISEKIRKEKSGG